MSTILSNLSKDTQGTQDNLNPAQSIIPILKRHTESLVIEEGACIAYQLSISSVVDGFVLDSYKFGIADENTLGEVSSGLTSSIVQVSNPNNTFIERFAFNTLIHSDSTGTLNTTTKTYEVGSNEVLVIKYCFYDANASQTLVTATPYVSADTEAYTIHLSADGGTNWELATNETPLTFANTGSQLAIKITGGTSQLITSDNYTFLTSASENFLVLGNSTITLIKCSYTLLG